MSQLAHTFVLCALLCAACGRQAGAQPTTEAYRDMREAEAQLERASAALADEPEEGRRKSLRGRLCQGASRVCELSGEISEADARARCAAAARRCQESGGHCCGMTAP